MNYVSNLRDTIRNLGYSLSVLFGFEVNRLTYAVLTPMNTYTELLQKAQLASSREEAIAILKEARYKELIENDYQLKAFEAACK